MCYLNCFGDNIYRHVVSGLLGASACEGSSVLEPRHYVLIEAIKTNHHGGCIRGVEEVVDPRLYYGSSRKCIEHTQKVKIDHLRIC